AAWRAIRVAWHFFVAVIIERDGSNPLSVSHRLIDIPKVVSGISGHMGRELIGGHDGSLEEGAIIRDVSFTLWAGCTQPARHRHTRDQYRQRPQSHSQRG